MHRRWMYDGVNLDRHGLKDHFVSGVAEFVEKAMTHPNFLVEGGIRCPYVNCKCIDLVTPREVNLHLYRDGFMPNYYVWTEHGEVDLNTNLGGHSSSGGSVGDEDQFAVMNQMVHDAIWPSIDVPDSNSSTGNEAFREDEEPNSEARHFYDTLISANQPIYEGATKSKLSISVKLLAARSIWKVPKKCIDYFAQILADVCPTKKCLPENNYQATQLVSKLGLKARKIDCCVNGCLLYYKENSNLTECRVCGAARYLPRKSGMGKFKDVPVK